MCECETAASVDGWPRDAVQDDDGGKEIAGIFFLILTPDKSWELSLDRQTRDDVLHPDVPISACKVTLSRQSHRFSWIPKAEP